MGVYPFALLPAGEHFLLAALAHLAFVPIGAGAGAKHATVLYPHD